MSKYTCKMLARTQGDLERLYFGGTDHCSVTEHTLWVQEFQGSNPSFSILMLWKRGTQMNQAVAGPFLHSYWSNRVSRQNLPAILCIGLQSSQSLISYYWGNDFYYIVTLGMSCRKCGTQESISLEVFPSAVCPERTTKAICAPQTVLGLQKTKCSANSALPPR